MLACKTAILNNLQKFLMGSEKELCYMTENNKTMWKSIWKIAYRLLALVLPFFIILPLYCANFQEYYMDDEYAMYHAQRDYLLENKDYNRVVILGDSRTKAGFMPKYLSDSTYNIALGGASPIEGYYSLKEYLSAHEAPETLIIAYAPMHYMDVDTLWTRTVYFHNITKEDAMELFETAKQFQNTDKILIEDYELEFLQYQLYMPNKYATALKNAGFFFRHTKTVAKYEAVTESKGHSFYGLLESSDGINGEAKVSDFAPSDIITHYMGEIFKLCEENGIQAIVEAAPMNETSYSIITDSFKENYRMYMAKLQKEHPEAEIYGDFYCYTNDHFGDADHLNEKGTKVFSQYIKEKYARVFTNEK